MAEHHFVKTVRRTKKESNLPETNKVTNKANKVKVLILDLSVDFVRKKEKSELLKEKIQKETDVHLTFRSYKINQRQLQRLSFIHQTASELQQARSDG